MKKYNIAVIGATGTVGRKTLDLLHKRKFPVGEIFAAASPKSVGKAVSFGDETVKVIQVGDIDFAKIDFAFFCAGGEVAQQYAKMAASLGCTVIDKSSLFRLDPEVPLIVPEVNVALLKNLKAGSIVASPNCCVIPLVVALKPLDNAAKIKRVIISTYQSASGAGKSGMDELYNQTKAKFIYEEITPQIFPAKIAFNLFPHIGNFRKDGSTDEEYKIKCELKKIMGGHLKVSVTCVRVAVFISHCMSINVEFEKELGANEAREILSEMEGIIAYSHNNEIKYSTPVDTVEQDEVFISRIRNDDSCKNTLNMWVTADNLRKGAALNAVQIAEEIIGKEQLTMQQ